MTSLQQKIDAIIQDLTEIDSAENFLFQKELDKALQEFREAIIDLQIELEQTTKNDEVTRCMIYAYDRILALLGEKK